MEPNDKGKKKILVVEDDKSVNAAMSAGLTNNGYLVTAKMNGAEGIEATNTNDFDVIILDLTMPKMDGLDVLKTLKANPKTKQIPVIIATNNTQTELVYECIAAGARDYFIKSDITLIQLCAAIDKALASIE